AIGLNAQTLPPLPDSMQQQLQRFQALPATHQFCPVDDSEVGRPMLLMVEVYDRQTKKPLVNKEVFMTQTSEAGVYDLSREGDWASARISGTVRTDQQGRYLIRSIVPGTYPNHPTAYPHIHLMIESLGKPYFDIVFLPYLNWYGKRDLRKKPEQRFAAKMWQYQGYEVGYVRVWVGD
ncbi:MAG: hypothetical protein AAFP02_06420, partial [Bacteroidota bacterium]